MNLFESKNLSTGIQESGVPQLDRSITTLPSEHYEAVPAMLQSGLLADGEQKTVRLSYFADLHGNYTALLQMKRIVQELRQRQCIDASISVGDNVEGGDDVELFYAIFDALAETVDFTALGDHEFDIHDADDLSRGAEWLRNRISSATGPSVERKLVLQEAALAAEDSVLAKAIFHSDLRVLAGNVLFEEQSDFATLSELQKIVPLKVLNIQGHTVLFLSVVNPTLQGCLEYHQRRGFNDSVHVMDQHPRDYILCQREQFRRLHPNLPFTLVVASHCGLSFDQEELAHPGIDLILGAHTHNEIYRVVHFSEGLKTHIVHSGQNGLNMGLVRFTPDTSGGINTLCHGLLKIPFDATTVENEIVVMGERLGYLDTELSLRGKSRASTPLTCFVADAIRTSGGTDAGLTFQGQIRAGLPEGDIYERHIAKVIPWDEELVSVSVNGSLVIRMIERSLERSRLGALDRPLLLHFSGIGYAVDASGKLASVWKEPGSGKETLMPEETLTLCCSEFMLTGLGDDFPLAGRMLTVKPLDRSLRSALGEGVVSWRGCKAGGDSRILIHPAAPLLCNDQSVVY